MLKTTHSNKKSKYYISMFAGISNWDNYEIISLRARERIFSPKNKQIHGFNLAPARHYTEHSYEGMCKCIELAISSIQVGEESDTNYSILIGNSNHTEHKINEKQQSSQNQHRQSKQVTIHFLDLTKQSYLLIFSAILTYCSNYEDDEESICHRQNWEGKCREDVTNSLHLQ